MKKESHKGLLLVALKTLIKNISRMYKIPICLYDANGDWVFSPKALPNHICPESQGKDHIKYKEIKSQLIKKCLYEKKIICDSNYSVTYVVPILIGKNIMGCLFINELVLTDEINEVSKENNFLYYLQDLVTDNLKKFQKKDSQINKLKQKISELEFIINKKEIISLESQLKPHFLFNTLNLVGQLIYLEKNAESLEVIYALSKLLRFALEKKELVRLIDEIDYVKNYLFIQNNRFEGKFKYHLDISEKTLSCLIPAFTLQPLVENAIKHGIKPKGDGIIRIYSRLVENRVILKVTDNGIGFINNNPEQPSLGTGINNLKRRLSFYFQEQYNFSINPLEEGGSEISISIPFETDKFNMYVPVFWFNK